MVDGDYGFGDEAKKLVSGRACCDAGLKGLVQLNFINQNQEAIIRAYDDIFSSLDLRQSES